MAQPKESKKKQHRILIIEDDADAQFVLKTLLSIHGFHVDAASNGQDGLRAVAANMPDLIILDVMMPVMNGVEVTRRLKAHPVTATIPIIMLTAVAEKKYMHAALFELDVDFYLTKPYDQDDLMDKVRHAIRFRRIPRDAVEGGKD